MPAALPDHVPNPRTPIVWDGTAYRAIRGHTDGTAHVRGEDQLHSFHSVLVNSRQAVISGAGGWSNSQPVPEGMIWHVTSIAAIDTTSPTTNHLYEFNHDGVGFSYYNAAAAFATGILSRWAGHIWMDHEDFIRVHFTGALAGDIIRIRLIGEQMTAET